MAADKTHLFKEACRLNHDNVAERALNMNMNFLGDTLSHAMRYKKLGFVDRILDRCIEIACFNHGTLDALRNVPMDKETRYKLIKYILDHCKSQLPLEVGVGLSESKIFEFLLDHIHADDFDAICAKVREKLAGISKALMGRLVVAYTSADYELTEKLCRLGVALGISELSYSEVLSSAVFAKDKRFIDIFLEYGVGVRFGERAKSMPLVLALQQENVELAMRLLDSASDFYAKDAQGVSVSQLLINLAGNKRRYDLLEKFLIKTKEQNHFVFEAYGILGDNFLPPVLVSRLEKNPIFTQLAVYLLRNTDLFKSFTVKHKDKYGFATRMSALQKWASFIKDIILRHICRDEFFSKNKLDLLRDIVNAKTPLGAVFHKARGLKSTNLHSGQLKLAIAELYQINSEESVLIADLAIAIQSKRFLDQSVKIWSRVKAFLFNPAITNEQKLALLAIRNKEGQTILSILSQDDQHFPDVLSSLNYLHVEHGMVAEELQVLMSLYGQKGDTRFIRYLEESVVAASPVAHAAAAHAGMFGHTQERVLPSLPPLYDPSAQPQSVQGPATAPHASMYHSTSSLVAAMPSVPRGELPPSYEEATRGRSYAPAPRRAVAE